MVLRIFKIALRLSVRQILMWQSLEIWNIFFNFEISFLKNQNAF